MALSTRSLFAVAAAAALLLWPALYNGYPIVFADTGTYLSQAIHRYAGWDRPVFYSVFMLPLHATVTVWPVVIAQALLTAWVLRLVCRVIAPALSEPAFVAIAAVLSACTWLPWIVSELMPDLFTPLLVLLLGLLIWVPERLSRRQQAVLAVLAAFMIASQISSVPLACVLSACLFLARTISGRGIPGTGRRLLLAALPPAVAVIALCTVNLAAHGRFSLSPFGNVFLLARVIYDGPGMQVLRRDCPAEQWRLCPFLHEFPPLSDDFLWAADSPLNKAGGAKAVSHDAGAIIQAALRADPFGEAAAALANTSEQLTRFADGDGLTPWPTQVSPWIQRDFPAREYAAYAAARQQAGTLAVPKLLAAMHRIAALAGVLACAVLLARSLKPTASPQPRANDLRCQSRPATGFLLAVLLALPLNAAITGSLSAPHDRYQARIMWLPLFVALVSLAAPNRKPLPASRA